MTEKIQILAVENDSTQQMLLQLLANKFHCDLILAFDCASAIKLLQEKAFSLILMDWRLDGECGLECAARIRNSNYPTHRKIPIVAVTANAMVGDREKCLAAGIDDYLSKPFSIESFGEMLERWTSLDPFHESQTSI